MKITKNDIKQAILEALNENPEQPAPTAPTSGEGDVNSAERALALQIYQKLLQVAGEPGMEMQNKIPIIEKILVMLIDKLKLELGVDLKRARMSQQATVQLAKDTAQGKVATPPANEACGDHMPTQEPEMHHQSHDESDMAKSQLSRASEYAAELEHMIHDGEELEAWVQAKITKAADYLSSVKHYLQYNKMKGDH
jgi:hypothetical protein